MGLDLGFSILLYDSTTKLYRPLFWQENQLAVYDQPENQETGDEFGASIAEYSNGFWLLGGYKPYLLSYYLAGVTGPLGHPKTETRYQGRGCSGLLKATHTSFSKAVDPRCCVCLVIDDLLEHEWEKSVKDHELTLDLLALLKEAKETFSWTKAHRAVLVVRCE
jgi:hypothetical protein